jgi:hypothetical protein
MKRRVAPLLLILLAACQREEAPVQRISLDAARGGPETPISAPDTKDAVWKVSADGQSIDFGAPTGKPYLTIECRQRAVPPMLRLIRHVASRPGESALFPVLGRGNSRFKLDAALEGGEWRWQGDLPASDELWDVFVTGGRLEATLPGGGSLKLDPSNIPGEFVTWCRSAGRTAVPASPAPASSQTPAQ